MEAIFFIAVPHTAEHAFIFKTGEAINGVL
jgi:hypothetical protein